MAIETEKKIRLTSEQREQVLRDLKEFGAKFVREDFETNIIYGGGILEEQESVLRIRKTENKSLLTYKRGIITENGIKQHIEHETEIADADEMAKVAECLGFEVGIVYEKRRQTWILQDIEIVLDELPFGLYMEIEGTLTEIATAEMILGLEDFEPETMTYPALTFHLGNKNGKTIEARF